MSAHPTTLALCQSQLSQLIVIDSQERLAAVMGAEDLAATVANIGRLIDTARLLDIPILSTEQYPGGLGRTIDAVREKLPQEVLPTEKTCFSCCTAAGFERNLVHEPDRKQVILAGMEAHICILQTAAGLQRWGYQVYVAGDAVCSRDPRSRDNALERMRHAGIQVTTTESVAFEWMGDSTHEKFRDVSRLFK
jgi:nicotinamidase-related amidase